MSGRVKRPGHTIAIPNDEPAIVTKYMIVSLIVGDWAGHHAVTYEAKYIYDGVCWLESWKGERMAKEVALQSENRHHHQNPSLSFVVARPLDDHR